MHLDNLNESYEREIIVMILGDKNDNREIIIKSLSEKMFFDKFYRRIFNICEHLLNANKEVNLYNVCEQLSIKEHEEAVAKIYSEYISNANYDFFIKKVQQRYFDELAKSAKTVDDMKAVNAEIAKWQNNVSLEHISKGADRLISDYYNSWETAVKSGYPSIDAKMGSFQGGDFIILAGATGMGKTCMMLNLMMNMACNGSKVGVFSLEMSKSQLQNRIIGAGAGINSSKFRDFTMTKEEQETHLRYAENELKKLPIEICTDYNITVDKIKQTVKSSDCDIYFIDYLGLISGGNNKNSYERLGEISRGIKLLALETNKPFFVLHQLNRGVFDRDDKRPKISDLRDSGKIEQDADAICFVHRPHYFDLKAPAEKLEFIIGKNRHNDSNQTIELIYNKNIQKVSEYEKIKSYS